MLFVLVAEAVARGETVFFFQLRNVESAFYLALAVAVYRVEPHRVADADDVVSVGYIKSKFVVADRRRGYRRFVLFKAL